MKTYLCTVEALEVGYARLGPDPVFTVQAHHPRQAALRAASLAQLPPGPPGDRVGVLVSEGESTWHYEVTREQRPAFHAREVDPGERLEPFWASADVCQACKRLNYR